MPFTCSRWTRRLYRSVLLFLPCAALFSLHSPAAAVPTTSGLAAADLQLVQESAALIRTYSLSAPKSTPSMADDIVRSYIHSIDQYGDFLTQKEYQAFIESNNADYFGVEMDIDKKNDHIYLYPFKDGLAERHGIRAGDELIAVNGVPVYGKSVFSVGATIRGSEGEAVQLTTSNAGGIPRVVTLRREDIAYESVQFHHFESADYIRITRFINDTSELLKKLLTYSVGNSKILILDLRRNQGGKLLEARQCADYFIDSGKIILRLQSRETSKIIRAKIKPLFTGRIFILQDRYTASAAEVLTAALVENGRAVSVGEQTFGKGLAQRFLPLSNGSALRLTYAEIRTPKDNSYNGKGLTPNISPSQALIEQDFTQSQNVENFLNDVELNKIN